MMDDHRFMGEALKEARKALSRGDFPVGCVLVYRDRVIARGRRKGTASGGGNELDHAEIVALRRLSKTKQGPEAAALTAFCTMEPCLMCFSALMLHGIGAIVYAYEDAMGGGTACPRARLSPLYRDSRIIVRGGIRRAESLALFKAFFSDPANRYWSASHLAAYTLKQ
jgi:tRNA(adenine34) deaminase